MNRAWQVKSLGDLCDIELGKTPERKTASYWDQKRETNNVWLSIADIPSSDHALVVDSKEYLSDEGAALCKMVKQGTLLVSFKLTLGRLAYAGRDLMTNEAIAALTIKDESVLIKTYLYWFLRFFDWDKAAEGDVKVKGKTLNKAKLKKINVLMPSVEQQQRIVAILDEAFAGIATATTNAEKNLQNARELFESTLQSVFAEKDEGWVSKKLEDILVAQPRNGWSPPASNHSDSGAKVLTLSSVTGFNFDISKFKYTSAQTRDEGHYWIDNDDLLITRSNTPELVGHVAIVSGIDEPTIYPDLIMRMKVDSKVALTRFVYYQLRTRKLRDLIKDGAKGANPTMKKISKGFVQSLPLLMPDIQTQEKLAGELDRISEETEKLEAIYQRKLNELSALKQSILQKAFAGEPH